MSKLKVGYSQVNANPPLGIGIDGYYVPRFAKGFLDDIEVISMVLTCGDTTVAMVSVDACLIEEDLIARFCTAAEKATGIKKENIPYLFTAFRRVDEESNRHIEGTGLGLAIVKQLVELMGGTISVNSIYTQGSTFISPRTPWVVTISPASK